MARNRNISDQIEKYLNYVVGDIMTIIPNMPDYSELRFFNSEEIKALVKCTSFYDSLQKKPDFIMHYDMSEWTPQILLDIKVIASEILQEAAATSYMS